MKGNVQCTQPSLFDSENAFASTHHALELVIRQGLELLNGGGDVDDFHDSATERIEVAENVFFAEIKLPAGGVRLFKSSRIEKSCY